VGKVIDRDKGWKKLREQFAAIAASKPVVAVGVTGKRGDAAHVNAHGLTVVDIAVVHEFGAGNVPERSFIRSTFDAGKSEYTRLLKGVGAKLAANPAYLPTALKRMGLKVEGDIKSRIAAGISPALHPLTLARKTRKSGAVATTPLIDSGQLRASITSVVRDGR
jgi:hypothetical protein